MRRTLEADDQKTACHNAESIDSETKAVIQGRNPVMRLENKRRGGNIGKHNPHGKRLYERILHERGIAQDGQIAEQCAFDARNAGIRLLHRLAEAEEENNQYKADNEQEHENAPPIGDAQQQPAQHRGKNRRKSLHRAEHREKTG